MGAGNSRQDADAEEGGGGAVGGVDPKGEGFGGENFGEGVVEAGGAVVAGLDEDMALSIKEIKVPDEKGNDFFRVGHEDALQGVVPVGIKLQDDAADRDGVE